jgi:tol-pal system protein YbgF
MRGNGTMRIINRLLAGSALVIALAAAGPGEAAMGIGMGLPATIAGDGNIVLAQAGDSERFARIENTMRNLTGQVEELTHQLRLLQEQLRLLQEDVDFRLGEIDGGAGAAPAQQQAAAPPQTQTDSIGTLAGEQPLGGEAQPGAPPQPLGQVIIDGGPGTQPLDLSSLAGGSVLDDLQAPLMGAEQQQVALAGPTGDPRTDYDQAYAMIRAGRYDLAENAFRQFLGVYPGSELAPEAQYWLGESLFARGDYARAAEEFRAGYKAYPTSRRGPDTLLKLGLSMAGLGYRDEACQMYAATLRQYPDMSNALLQRVRNEQASASC